MWSGIKIDFRFVNLKRRNYTLIFHYRTLMASPNDYTDVRKALFTSPGVDITEKIDNNGLSLNNRMQVEQETDTALKSAQKDAHEVRMKKFRQLAKRLSEDDWQYPSIEKLIGLK